MTSPKQAETPRPFDVGGRLPSGVTVLEASAGTGKTFTIAALAARFVAEVGVPLEELLLVTFTRMATSELRDRVRRKFLDLERALAAVRAGEEPDPDDEVLAALLRDADHDEVARRHGRLSDALAHFDAATIATTHGFCQHVLGSLGVAGDVDRDATFVEDSRAYVDEVVDDLFVRKFSRHDGEPPFTLKQARTLAMEVVRNSDAELQPTTAKRDSPNDLRLRIAEKAKAEVARRRKLASVLTYDDLLTRLDDTLADDERGAAACQRLRERYRVVLVDEFQDTDPIQWNILRRAFAEDPTGRSVLVLIGDPKQAIYAFRGADVHAYLAAAKGAGDRATLTTNWRSDQDLLDAFDALFGNARLGHEGIEYRRVQACPDHEGRRLAGAPDGAALRVRLLPKGDNKTLTVGDARVRIGADVANEIAELLSSGATFDGRAVEAGDIAVLVHRNDDARTVHAALGDVGVPAVINGAGSVFSTEAAVEWRKLLEALERPSARTPAAAVALTPFVGWEPREVAEATEDTWETLHSMLHRWAAVLRRRGVASLLETISVERGMPGRVLALAGGERTLTDLRHVGRLLHAEATSEQLGTTALANWLRLRIEDADDDVIDSEERTRRLESDADAVQVLTIYRAKGLEYPFVYCPFVWDPAWSHPDNPPVYHPADDHHRVLWVGKRDKNTVDEASDLSLRERRGEELRLLYVALTRAMVQAVVWWAPANGSENGPLTRLVFGRGADGKVAPYKSKGSIPRDEGARARFEEIAASVPGKMSVTVVDPVATIDSALGGGRARATSAPGSAAPSELVAASFDRTLDPRWRRTSYTGITSSLGHEARVASEAEAPVVTDEAVVEVAPSPPDDDDGAGPSSGVPCLLATMRSGAEVGTFIHQVLEGADFAAADLDVELEASYAKAELRSLVDVGERADVLRGLASVVETPLGPLLGDLRLRDVGRRDRVDELWFELPLAGGDSPSGSFTVESIATLLRRFCGSDDVLAGYADYLDDPSLRSELRGYLAGSLDLVLRTPDGRYAVADYKTNWLGVDGQELSTWHYRPAALNDAMYRAHYPLQALLYTVALHRFLRWRVPGYSAEQHLAGVLYLFVRGMVGESTPVVDGGRCGVWSWQPPAGLVEALSDLFDAGSVEAGAVA